MLEVSDDSGFLALIVPTTYETFVGSNWTFDQIMAHFHTSDGTRVTPHLRNGTGGKLES